MDKAPTGSSLQQEIKSVDSHARGPSGGLPGEKRQGSGKLFLAGGLIFGAIGVARIFTLIGTAWSVVIETCGEGTPEQLDRSQIAVGIVAGILAVICAETGTRREKGKIVWLGMLGSVMGIFATLSGAAMALLLLLPPEC